jgi:hypothetical protein
VIADDTRVAWCLLHTDLVTAPTLTRHRRVMTIVLACAAVGAGVLAFEVLTPVRADRRSAAGDRGQPDPTFGVPSTAAGDRVGPRVHTTRATIGTTNGVPTDVDHVAALRRGLASDDEATRVAAVEAAVGATAVETLGDLEQFDLARDPEAAPTVIHAVALLGASAEGSKRDEAAATLARWLREERRRDGPDVAGNVSNIIEALGNVGGSGAVETLSAALDRGDLAIHVQTLAVTKLGELGDVHARGAVERFGARVAALPPAEGIDEELRVEAIAAAAGTLSKL